MRGQESGHTSVIRGDNADLFFNIYGLFHYYMVVGGGEKEKLALSLNATSAQIHYGH